MNAFILFLILFTFACENRDRRYFYYKDRDDDYRAVISRIRDVGVNRRFDVRATLKDHRNDTFTARTEVELLLIGGNRNAELRGDTERKTTRGRVTFSNLRIDRGGRNYRLRLTFEIDDEIYYSRSNYFDVIDDDDYDDDGISIGGSLFSVEMDGLPDRIEAGRALPDLTFTMKMLGNESTGGTVTLKVRDTRGAKRDDALLVWRNPSLSAGVSSGKAVFTEAFFTQELDEGAELIARAVRFVGTEEFYLPRVRPAVITADVSRVTVSMGNTQVYAVLRIDDLPCVNCTVNSYLVGGDKVKDAAVTTTDNNGMFVATIADWVCITGRSYQGAVKVFHMRSNYYTMLRANCG